MTFGFPKPVRVEDPELLAQFRRFPCLACHPGTQAYPTEAHHITTRGAGGSDVPSNLMPLCTQHHRQWHASKGAAQLIRQCPRVKGWLRHWERRDIFERYGVAYPKA